MGAQILASDLELSLQVTVLGGGAVIDMTDFCLHNWSKHKRKWVN